MELYRAETYKQLQVLNLLDVVIVSKRKKNIEMIFSHFFNDSFDLFFYFFYQYKYSSIGKWW